jgi:hypothetical protein
LVVVCPWICGVVDLLCREGSWLRSGVIWRDFAAELFAPIDALAVAAPGAA